MLCPLRKSFFHYYYKKHIVRLWKVCLFYAKKYSTDKLFIFRVNVLQRNANSFDDKGRERTFFPRNSDFYLLYNIVWKAYRFICSSWYSRNPKFAHKLTSVLHLVILIVMYPPCNMCIAIALHNWAENDIILLR